MVTHKSLLGLALSCELPSKPPAQPLPSTHLVLPKGKYIRPVTLACSSLTIPLSIASNTYNKSELIKYKFMSFLKILLDKWRA